MTWMYASSTPRARWQGDRTRFNRRSALAGGNSGVLTAQIGVQSARGSGEGTLHCYHAYIHVIHPKQVFGLTGTGIPAILEALHVNPSLTAFGPSRADQLNDNSLHYAVHECLPQKARLERGQELFPCRGVQQGYLSNFAAQFEPRATVRCLLCPPERQDGDPWCQWVFEVNDNDGVAVPDSTGKPIR